MNWLADRFVSCSLHRLSSVFAVSGPWLTLRLPRLRGTFCRVAEVALLFHPGVHLRGQFRDRSGLRGHGCEIRQAPGIAGQVVKFLWRTSDVGIGP